LKRIFLIPESLDEFRQSSQRAGEAIGKNPAFTIAIGLIKTGYMVNDAHTPHFTAYGLQHTLGEFVFFA
jgi:hypothetical protein